MIYLASPYSHPDPDVRTHRWSQVLDATAELMRQGLTVYSPIVHSHHVALFHDLPGDWAFWRDHCLGMLRRADQLLVLTLDGWTDSTGVLAEIHAAQDRRLLIETIEPGTWHRATWWEPPCSLLIPQAG